MSDKDFESQTDVQRHEENEEKLVPVSEAIRYRKRAQAAEQKAQQLEDELASSHSDKERLSDELERIRFERKLTDSLAKAGALDVETAVSVIRERLRGDRQADVEQAVEKLRDEKRFLFAEKSGPAYPKMTAGQKSAGTVKNAVLESSAKKASATGNRADVRDYMKVRREFM